jgi:hypothetical protein
MYISENRQDRNRSYSIIFRKLAFFKFVTAMLCACEERSLRIPKSLSGEFTTEKAILELLKKEALVGARVEKIYLGNVHVQNRTGSIRL